MRQLGFILFFYIITVFSAVDALAEAGVSGHPFLPAERSASPSSSIKTLSNSDFTARVNQYSTDSTKQIGATVDQQTAEIIANSKQNNPPTNQAMPPPNPGDQHPPTEEMQQAPPQNEIPEEVPEEEELPPATEEAPPNGLSAIPQSGTATSPQPSPKNSSPDQQQSGIWQIQY